MKLSFNSMLYAFSRGLDYVEHDLLGVSTHHSKRVAYIAVSLGGQFGFTHKEKSDLAGCALLHDNALTEYIQEEFELGRRALDGEQGNFSRHCTIGEENIKSIPFFGDVSDVVLYHHERADGDGPFGKKAPDIPPYAALIHMADELDTIFHLNEVNREKYRQVIDFLKRNTGPNYFPEHAEAFLDIFDRRMLQRLRDEELEASLNLALPKFRTEYSPEEVISFAPFFAKIIDYKSRFTKNHSMELAEKAGIIADYYRFDPEKKSIFFLAAALHDIGKLAIDTRILEKPDRLTKQEFSEVKNHAWHSYKILSEIDGFQAYNSWASFHHEKLDGSGYPFGYKAKDLGFEERLMACLDIYQALVEKRPYKDGMKHAEAVGILDRMAKDGLLDHGIVGNLAERFA